MNKNINILSLITPVDKVPTVLYDCSLRQALEKMKAHNYKVIPVLYEDGTYAGSVSEGDFLWFTLEHDDIKNLEDCEKYKVTEIMKVAYYPPIRINATYSYLLNCIKEQKYVPLVDDRCYLIGIVTRSDIVKALDEC